MKWGKKKQVWELKKNKGLLVRSNICDKANFTALLIDFGSLPLINRRRKKRPKIKDQIKASKERKI